jgi:hypothetical protein
MPTDTTRKDGSERLIRLPIATLMREMFQKDLESLSMRHAAESAFLCDVASTDLGHHAGSVDV